MLTGISVGSAAWLMTVLPGGDTRQHLSLALAYVGLGLLATTLALGPINLLRRRPNPVSFDLRRDLGIWAAILGLAHTLVGLTVHFRGKMHLYFLAPPDHPSPILLRLDAFGLSNHAGLLAALLLILLLVISNDQAFARLGAERWKRLQRATYVMAALTAGHGIAYQILEHRPCRWVLLIGLVGGACGLLQGLGWREVAQLRRRPRR